MAPLDRLVWADSVAIRLYGVRIGLRVSHAPWLPLLLERIPGPVRASRSGLVDRVFSIQEGGVQPGSGVRRFHLCWSDHKVAGRSLVREPVVDAFATAIRALLATESRGYEFVRAGCVGWRGRAIVVPGFARTGTSTLVRALVERGATFYSDEFAVFDRRGRLHPFPALREAESRAPLPVGLVVQTAYSDGAEWRPQTLAPSETVLALLPHAARAGAASDALKSRVARSAAGAIGIRTPRGDAADAAARILETATSSRR